MWKLIFFNFNSEWSARNNRERKKTHKTGTNYWWTFGKKSKQTITTSQWICERFDFGCFESVFFSHEFSAEANFLDECGGWLRYASTVVYSSGTRNWCSTYADRRSLLMTYNRVAYDNKTPYYLCAIKLNKWEKKKQREANDAPLFITLDLISWPVWLGTWAHVFVCMSTGFISYINGNLSHFQCS